MGELSVLLIDSDRDFTESLVARIGAGDHRISLASGAREGQAQASAIRPDLVVIDVDLPDGNGFKVFKKIKKDKSLAATRFVITGNEVPEKTFADHRKLRLHADLYLHKPVSSEQFVKQVKDALDVDLTVETAASEDDVLGELDTLLDAVPSETSPTSDPDTDVDLAELDRLLGDESETVAPPPMPDDMPPIPDEDTPVMPEPAAADSDEVAAEMSPEADLDEALEETAEWDNHELDDLMEAGEEPEIDQPVDDPEALPEWETAAEETLETEWADDDSLSEQPDVVLETKEDTEGLGALVETALMVDDEEESEQSQSAEAQVQEVLSEVQGVIDERNQLRNELEGLKATLTQQQSEHDRVTEETEKLRQYLDDLEKALRARDEEIDLLKLRLVDETEGVRSSLIGELEHLKAELRQTHDAEEALQQELATAQNEVVEQKETLETAQRDLQNIRGEMEESLREALTRAETAEADLENARSHSSELESRLNDLEAQFEDLHQKHEKIVAQKEEDLKRRLQEQKDAAQAEAETLRKEKAAFEQAAERTPELEKEIAALRDDHSQLKSDSEARIAELEQQVKELSTANRVNEERVIKAYRKIKQETEQRARSEKALAIALNIVRGEPKDGGSSKPPAQ